MIRIIRVILSNMNTTKLQYSNTVNHHNTVFGGGLC